MVAYNFKQRFEDPIMKGTKRQTIRAEGFKRHARPGERLQLYTGLRTKAARMLRDELCEFVHRIAFDFDAGAIYVDDEMILGRGELDDFAQLDGFTDYDDMLAFWSSEHFKGRKPHGGWFGVLIKW